MADFIKYIVYSRRELLFGIHWGGNKVNGTEKRLIKKVTIINLQT
jgi:hypothetical protein